MLIRVREPSTGLVSLDAIYRWAESRGYPAQDEHIVVEGIPTQFVPSLPDVA